MLYLAGIHSYKGPAMVITEDGAEVPGTVNLRKSPAVFTGGGRDTHLPDDLNSMVNRAEGRIRFPDGMEATFLIPDPSDLVDHGLTIIGQSDTPF